MQAPEVSVILAAFNRVKYLQEAIASVLAQTHTDWELIVADDGSDDETRTFLKSLRDARITTLWLPHSGNPGAVRNRAIQRARGIYLAFLDSDDVWTSRKLAIQLALMKSRRDRRWSYARNRIVDGHGNPVSDADLPPWVPHEGFILEPLLKLEAHVSTPSVMAERDLVTEVGGYDEEQRYAEDYDLWLRLAMSSEVSVSDERLVRVRWRIDSYSSDRVAATQGWVRLYGKWTHIVPDSRLRSLCRHRRGKMALILVGLYMDRGDHRAAARTVLAASRYSWPYFEFWWGALKTVSRPVVPPWLQSRYRRWRG